MCSVFWILGQIISIESESVQNSNLQKGPNCTKDFPKVETISRNDANNKTKDDKTSKRKVLGVYSTNQYRSFAACF